MFFHCGCVCACATAHGWMSDDNPWGDSVLTFHHVGAGNEILSQTKLKDWSHLLSNDMYPAAGNPMRSVGLGGHNAQVADARASLRKENTTKREKGVCLTCCQVSSGRVGGSLLCFPEPGSASLAYAPRWPAAASPKTPVAGRELGPAQRRSGLAPRHARCRLGNVGSSEERGCLVSCLSPPPPQTGSTSQPYQGRRPFTASSLTFPRGRACFPVRSAAMAGTRSTSSLGRLASAPKSMVYKFT